MPFWRPGSAAASSVRKIPACQTLFGNLAVQIVDAFLHGLLGVALGIDHLKMIHVGVKQNDLSFSAFQEVKGVRHQHLVFLAEVGGEDDFHGRLVLESDKITEISEYRRNEGVDDFGFDEAALAFGQQREGGVTVL